MTAQHPLHDALQLAGFALAHAVWCVSEGETLIPMLMHERAGVPERSLVRFASEPFEQGVAQGKRWIAANDAGSTSAVLVYDGFLTLEGNRRDALFADIVAFGPPRTGVTMALPYRPPRGVAFAVYRPKVVGVLDTDPATLGTVLYRLWEGVDAHQQGAEIWNAHLDQSE